MPNPDALTFILRDTTVVVDLQPVLAGGALKPGDQYHFVKHALGLKTGEVTEIHQHSGTRNLMIGLESEDLYNSVLKKLEDGVEWTKYPGMTFHGWSTREYLTSATIVNYTKKLGIAGIVKKLEEYGKVISHRFGVFKEDPTIANGKVHFRIKMNDGVKLPSIIEIPSAGEMVEVFSDSTEKVCFKCTKKGHIAAFCRFKAQDMDYANNPTPTWAQIVSQSNNAGSQGAVATGNLTGTGARPQNGAGALQPVGGVAGQGGQVVPTPPGAPGPSHAPSPGAQGRLSRRSSQSGAAGEESGGLAEGQQAPGAEKGQVDTSGSMFTMSEHSPKVIPETPENPASNLSDSVSSKSDQELDEHGMLPPGQVDKEGNLASGKPENTNKELFGSSESEEGLPPAQKKSESSSDEDNTEDMEEAAESSTSHQKEKWEVKQSKKRKSENKLKKKKKKRSARASASRSSANGGLSREAFLKQNDKPYL